MRVRLFVPLLAILFGVMGCEELSSISSNYESGAVNPGTLNPDSSGAPDSTDTASCDVCRSDETLQLSWLPDSIDVIGYKIYYSAEPYISERELENLDAATDNFDLQAPAVSYHAWNDLSLYKGDNVCFRILAYTLSGNETLSQEACGRLPDETQTATRTNQEQAALAS